MSVEIREVTSKKELKKFVKFNIELYKGKSLSRTGFNRGRDDDAG